MMRAAAAEGAEPRKVRCCLCLSIFCSGSELVGRDASASANSLSSHPTEESSPSIFSSALPPMCRLFGVRRPSRKVTSVPPV